MPAEIPIAIVVAADDAYAMPMAVTVKSVLLHADPSRKLCFYIFDCGITDETKQRLLASWQDNRAEFLWVKPDLSLLSGLAVSRHVSLSTYARLLIPLSLPPELEKVIYLDSDLLVLGDIATLNSEPLQDWHCLAAADPGYPWMECELVLGNFRECGPYLVGRRPIENYRALGFLPSDPYFNAGVLVINLTRWRESNVAGASIACLHEHKEFVKNWDQYALNVVLHGRWKPIDMRWNQGTWIYCYPSAACSPFDRATFDAVRYRPLICHFTTGDKPWKIGNLHPFRRRYFEVVDRTDWAGWRPGTRWQRVSRIAMGYLSRLARISWQDVRNLPSRLQRLFSRKPGADSGE
jgi:lipopolysaccharide biosynthesis glycosyltransferase